MRGGKVFFLPCCFLSFPEQNRLEEEAAAGKEARSVSVVGVGQVCVP